MFPPHKPKGIQTVVCAVEKGLHGGNILQSVVIDSGNFLLKINFPDYNSVAMSLYDIRTILCMKIHLCLDFSEAAIC